MNNILTVLQTLLEEFREKISVFEIGIDRGSLPKIAHKIIVTIGMRRTGKTHSLMQAIKNLLKEGVSIEQILYINFEDDRLSPLTQEKLRQLLDGFYSLYPENHSKECYLFLDEIQTVEDWPLVIRRYFETKKVKIFLSGSSSKLLSKEIATSLRGRSYAVEIWPYNFHEFLQAKEIAYPQTLGKINLDKLTVLLRDYLKNGGFPEIVALPQPEIIENSRKILQDYVAVVALRDITERHHITNVLPLHYLINSLLRNTACLLSANKMHGDLKSQGFEIGKSAIYAYLSYIEDAYLAFATPIFSESIRKTHSNPRKFYAVDTGLANSYHIGFSENIGHYFENLVYLDLRRAGHTIFYYLTQDRQEVDFCSQDRKGRWHLWQVCWNCEDVKTYTREMAALRAAEQELKITGKLITPHSYFSEFLPSLQKH